MKAQIPSPVQTPTLVLLMTMFFFSGTYAQKATYTVGGLTLGLGTGATYQVSDIPNSQGIAYDFTLGTPIWKKPNAFFGLDWKFRFLAGKNEAFDHNINTEDGTYSNIQYKFFNYDLELGLTLNRLRERTGFVLTGFAGAGATHGLTFTDELDAGNNAYDFSGIDPNRDKLLVYEDLVSLSDLNFETNQIKKLALLPSAGFFIGYQFSQAFTLGIEYKTNFYLSEQDGLMGLDLDNNPVSGSKIDRNNYVSLGFKLGLGGGRSVDNTATLTENYHNNAVASAINAPTVHFTDPANETSTAQSPNKILKARIENVSGADNIKFSQNGYPNYNFSYSESTKVFSVRVRLRDGMNDFTIEAANQAGRADDRASIILTIPEKTVPVATNITPPTNEIKAAAVQIPLPTVKITNPSQPVTVEDNRFSLRAETRNVRQRNDVSLKFNGTELGTFSFTSYSGVSAGLVLEEGINTVELTVYNDAGQATDRTSIIYRKPKPRVTPATRRTNTSYTNTQPSTKTVITNETVVIEDPRVQKDKPRTEEAVISTKPQVSTEKKPCQPPSLSIRVNEVNRLDATHMLRGSVVNGDRRTNIMFSIDGRSYEKYTFDPGTGALNAKFRLTGGKHRILVEVANACGSDSKSVNVNYVEDEEEHKEVKPVVENPVVEVIEDPVEVVVQENIPSEDPTEDVVEETANCGVRINPGNSAWEFCLQTPSGTFNRDNLRNSNFTYTGPASSLYFKPIGGGGDALVNGRPYTLKAGQYYLFTGNMTVTVSKRNPGSMGQWSVCISTNKAPVTGNGNKRPESPCAE